MTQTEELLALAQRVLVPTYAPPALVPRRGAGSRLWDLDGTEYLDFTTGIAVNALGHAHPDVVRAITEQASRFSHTANIFFHEGHVRVAEKLVERSFGQRVFLTNSGTEAMEGALKLARRWFWKRGDARDGFVATQGSFHGRTMGAVSITGQTAYREGFGRMLEPVALVPYGDIDALATAVGPSTCAVVLEPIQANGGVNMPPPGYVAAVRKLCTERGVLFIVDEIQTGVGRTGRWFGYEHEGVTPDIMTLAKALGGGLPLGAMVTTDELAAVMDVGSHGTTFGGNPVACAAGLATLAVLERDHLVERVAERAPSFMSALRQLAQRHPVVRDVRGRGYLIGVELEGAAKHYEERCRHERLLVTTSGKNVLRILPPLLASDAELDECLGKLGRALA